MLDVHPPHGEMHGVRDFLLHLFTITVGLLIALALEGCAERWHHRELRKEADANLRLEIQDNARELSQAQMAIAKEQTNLQHALEFLEARKANRSYDSHGIRLDLTIGDLSDASWKTAAATGALSYMEYDHAQRYATLYQLQDRFTALQTQTINNFLQLQSDVIYGFDPDKVTPQDAAAAEPDVRRTLATLTGMGQIGKAVSAEYDKTLKEE
jgi:hypothetical protein